MTHLEINLLAVLLKTGPLHFGHGETLNIHFTVPISVDEFKNIPLDQVFDKLAKDGTKELENLMKHWKNQIHAMLE